MLPTLAVMEVLSESEQDEDSSLEVNPVIDKTINTPTIVSLVSPPSPGCESQSLLPDGKRGSRKKIYWSGFYVIIAEAQE